MCTCRVPSARAAAAKCWLPASSSAGLPRQSLHSCCPSREHASSHCALRCAAPAALLAACSTVTDLRPWAASSGLTSAITWHPHLETTHCCFLSHRYALPFVAWLAMAAIPVRLETQWRPGTSVICPKIRSIIRCQNGLKAWDRPGAEATCMKLHREHRLRLRHTEQAVHHPGGGQHARCRRLGAGLPSGPGRAGCIQPLCSDPLACLLLCCSGCSLPGEAPGSVLACMQ